MVGLPGTGKTLLARAVAGEAEVPFFALTGSSFVEIGFGVGASRARAVFADACKRGPSIIFIDEIDAIGQQRGGSVFSNDEREQTLNQLLAEMDGFDPTTCVVVSPSCQHFRPRRDQRGQTRRTPPGGATDWDVHFVMLPVGDWCLAT